VEVKIPVSNDEVPAPPTKIEPPIDNLERGDEVPMPTKPLAPET